MGDHSALAGGIPRLSDLRLRPVVAVAPDVPLDRAARVMRAHDVSSLVVSEPGEAISVVTERDLTAAMADGLDAGTPVGEVAAPNPLSLPLVATVLDAAAVMLGTGVRHLVVTLERRAVGVVSMRDVLAAVVRHVRPELVLDTVEQVVVDVPEHWLL
ncbi:MAG TPA: CBS domain-containing protein [Acidimicrobiales bacterium]